MGGGDLAHGGGLSLDGFEVSQPVVTAHGVVGGDGVAALGGAQLELAAVAVVLGGGVLAEADVGVDEHDHHGVVQRDVALGVVLEQEKHGPEVGVVHDRAVALLPAAHRDA